MGNVGFQNRKVFLFLRNLPSSLAFYSKFRVAFPPVRYSQQIKCREAGRRLILWSNPFTKRCLLCPLLVVIIQLLSHVQLFVTPWTAAHQASLSFIISQSLLKLKSIKLMMPSNHLILCHPLLLLSSIFPSIRVFSNEPTLHQVDAKVLELQLQLQSFQWIFRVDFP